MKKLLLLIFGMFLISLTSAVINVTLPVEAPTNLSATLLSGGTFEANTTYYYVVVAYSNEKQTISTFNNQISPANICNYFSPLSEEKNFTTNSTHKAVFFDWDASVVSTGKPVYYQILITKESGNYTRAGGYGTSTEYVGTITSTNYTANNPNNGTLAIHTANLNNNLPFYLNKTTGIIKVYIDNEILTSSGVIYYKYALQRIYEEIVSAGYSDYVYWDGYNFALKGWIDISGSNFTRLEIRDANINFIKGGLYINNVNASITLGYYTDDYSGANYYYGVNVVALNSRYPINNINSNGNLSIYGSKVAIYNTFPWRLAENLSITYFFTSNGAYVNDAGGYKDSIFDLGLRATTTELSDLKLAITNNWGNFDTFRLKVTDTASFCYTSLCRIYAPEFTGNLNVGSSGLRFYIPATGANYTTYMYDPIFSQYYETNNNIPPQVFFSTTYGVLHNDAHLKVFHTIKTKVIDKDGNPLENVTIYLTDKDGNPYNWTEQDGTFDRRVTGNEYLYNISTDANGTTDYYVRSYRIGINQSNDIVNNYCNNSNYTYYYPFTLTFEKEGYKNYTIILDTLTDKKDLLISLEEQPTWDYSKKIIFMIRDMFSSFSSMLKIDEEGNLGIKGVVIENTNVSAYDNLFCFNKLNNSCITKNGNLVLKGELVEGGE